MESTQIKESSVQNDPPESSGQQNEPINTVRLFNNQKSFQWQKSEESERTRRRRLEIKEDGKEVGQISKQEVGGDLDRGKVMQRIMDKCQEKFSDIVKC